MTNKLILHKQKGQWITLSAAVLASVAIVGNHRASAESSVEDVSYQLWEEVVLESTETIEESAVLEDNTLEEISADLSQELLEKNQEVIDLNIQEYGFVEGGKGDAVYTQGTVGSRKVHVVQAGEWVNKIASMYGVSGSQIVAWNNLSSNLLIHPGQTLYVSGPETVETPATSPEETTNEALSNTGAVSPTRPLSNQSATIHTVGAGDYLWLVAQKYGVTIDQIRTWNNLSSNMLYVGDRLLVSAPRTAQTVTNLSPNQEQTHRETISTPSSTTRKTYTVRPGDYLYLIAVENGVTVNQLKEWNQLSSNYIYSGDVLFVSNPKSVISTSSPKKEVEKTSELPKSQVKPEGNTSSVEQVQQSAIKTYTVKPGDYLYLIASENGITVNQLKEWNKLSSNYIYSGDVLVVEDPSLRPSSGLVANQVASAEEDNRNLGNVETVEKRRTYLVKAGDSINYISNRFSIKPNDLRAWNDLRSNLIHPGQLLYVSPLTEMVVNEDDVPEDVLSEKINELVEENIDEELEELFKEAEEATVEFVMPKTHTVKSGEYLYLIASQNGVSVDQIIRWNQLESNYLYAGQKLIVSDPSNSVLVNGKVYNPTTVASNSVEYPNTVTPEAMAVQMNIPILSQFDPRWKDAEYGNDVSKSIWENGCAIVSLAMIDSYLQGEVINPASIAEWAGLDHYVWGVGTAWSAFPAFAEDRGYQITDHGRNVNAALAEVEKGKPALVSVRPGYFINAGHLMVVRGYDRTTDTVFVNDPYDNPNRAKSNSNRGHSAQHLRNDASGIWSFSRLR